MVSNNRSEEPRLKILFDTGAGLHVCPFHFGQEYACTPLTDDTRIIGIDGQSSIPVYGWRCIFIRFTPTFSAWVRFLVADVSHAVISFTQISNKGFRAVLGEDAYLQYGLERIPIHREGSLLFIWPMALMNIQTEDTSELVLAFNRNRIWTGLKTRYHGVQDWWELLDDRVTLRRHLEQERTYFFNPKFISKTGSTLPPGLTYHDLEDWRQTHIKRPDDTYEIFEHNDWKLKKKMVKPDGIDWRWRGFTDFRLKAPFHG